MRKPTGARLLLVLALVLRLGDFDEHVGHVIPGSPPVSEQEPGLAGVLRRWACACSSAVRTRRVGRPSTRKGIKLDPPGTLRISGAADEPSITSRYTGFSFLKNRSRPGRDVGTPELEQPG